MIISFTLNGRPRTVDVEPATLVAELLRENLNLTGTHVGCDTSQCGACVVLFNGEAVKSCTLLAPMLEAGTLADDRRVVGPGRFEPAASDAGSVSSKSRPAMWLLHARHGDDGGGADGEESGADGSRSSPRSRRQHLPLQPAIRISWHRSWPVRRR